MASRLAGKTILITGASSGIGRATALEFARASPSSLRLVLAARRLDSLHKLAAQINKEAGAGVRVHSAQLDVSVPDAVRGFVASLPDEYRDINVLVNNAGLVKGIAKSPDIKEEHINTVFSTNVLGLINMTQAILPIYLARGGHGDIINIGSIAAREAYPTGSIYCASKAAIRSYTDSLRKELIATRIRVIEIDPGQVETEFSLVRFDGDQAKADAVYAGCEPLTPEDVAETIVFAAGRRENVVIAESLLFPNHQAAAQVLHRKNT
ncbi:oxidoreductase [Ophiocordyceps camponoti-floridani]|uniref:Oxidoreductase n=1 Tax=Ophiocordyceps camponoti-floridani TaxID=2030778 RepID=A0A8H4Q3N0_9HYPO|nr:oxidoreductase [Ophiocordyceps camponoti-floridani]